MPSEMTDETVTHRVVEIVSAHRDLEGPLLPILHAISADFGYVPPAALPAIATELNISRAEVHGVVSFYHDFKTHPVGRHMVKICRAEACQAMGANALCDDALTRLGVDWHETTANGAVTIEPAFCLGLCACGPAAMVDGRVIGRIDSDRLADILTEVGA